jgi:signal peptidase I
MSRPLGRLKPRRWLTWAIDALLLAAVGCAVFIGYGSLPNMWYRVIVVAGGSMEPALAPGDLMVVTPPPSVVEPGMILVLQVDDRLITHRVTAVRADGTFETKGDANRVADDFAGRDVRVYGRYAWTVPLPGIGRYLPIRGSAADFLERWSATQEYSIGRWQDAAPEVIEPPVAEEPREPEVIESPIAQEEPELIDPPATDEPRQPEASESPAIEQPRQPEAVESPDAEEPRQPEATESPVAEEPRQPQAIDFAALPDRTYGHRPEEPGAMASSGLPVRYEAEGACAMAEGRIELRRAGTCTVTARQPGDEVWLPAEPVTRQFAVQRAEPSFTFDLADLPPKAVGDEPFSLAGFVSHDGTGEVTFGLGEGSVGCAVSQAGLVTLEREALDPNACRIAVRMSADERYREAGPLVGAFHVEPAPEAEDEPVSPPPAADTRPPALALNAHPDRETEARRALFRFDADEPARYECRLDGAEFGPCERPVEYADLATGGHAFRVKAIDEAGNVSEVVVFEWTIVEPPPPPPPAAPECQAGSVTVHAGADTWISQSSPDQNFGRDPVLRVDANGAATAQGMVRFPLPDIPPACVVKDAQLNIFAASWIDGRTLEAIRLTGDWQEEGVTWNTQPPTGGEPATVGSGPEWRTWSITGQVRAQYESGNHGFLIRDPVGDPGTVEQVFRANEDGNTRPHIVVTYGPPG